MISDIRYNHFVHEAGSLLAELRTLGATFEEINRAKSLLEHATPQSIGAIIHDLQSQVSSLQEFNTTNGINPDCFDEEWEEELYGN